MGNPYISINRMVWVYFQDERSRCRGHTEFGNHGHLQATMVTALHAASRNKRISLSLNVTQTQVII